MDTHLSDVPWSARQVGGVWREYIFAARQAIQLSQAGDDILSAAARVSSENSTFSYAATAEPDTLCDICPACLGRGWVHFPSARCSWCVGTGRIERPDLPTPEEQIDYTEMLEREDDIADDLARADEAAWREENSDD